jgi:hypothetical protein
LCRQPHGREAKKEQRGDGPQVFDPHWSLDIPPAASDCVVGPFVGNFVGSFVEAVISAFS